MEFSPDLERLLNKWPSRTARERRIVKKLFSHVDALLQADDRMHFFIESPEWPGITPVDVIKYLRVEPQELKTVHEVYYFLETLPLADLLIAMTLWEEPIEEVKWEDNGF